MFLRWVRSRHRLAKDQIYTLGWSGPPWVQRPRHRHQPSRGNDGEWLANAIRQGVITARRGGPLRDDETGSREIEALLKMSQLTSVFEWVTDLKALLFPQCQTSPFIADPALPLAVQMGQLWTETVSPSPSHRVCRAALPGKGPQQGQKAKILSGPWAGAGAVRAALLASFHQNETKEVAKSCGVGKVLFLRGPLPNVGGPKGWLADR